MNNFKLLTKKFNISILFIFLIGTLSHFLYDLSGQKNIVGSIFPANESVWEHLKLLLIPVITWWVLYYLINKDKLYPYKNKWFFGSVSALISSMFFQLSIFYIYTCALGFESSLVVDISIFIFAIIFGQFIGLHFYKYSNGINYIISIIILILIIILFIYLTFNPLSLPIFYDRLTGKYGI